MDKKALLILGASNDQLFMIHSAHQMGLITVVVDGNGNAPGLQLADYAKVLDFSDTDAVISYCQQLIAMGVNLSGVLTMGSDIPHLLATIAAPFGWHAPSAEVARITTNKFLMKEHFKAHHIAIPAYALVTNSDQIEAYWQSWQCRSIIIKPVDAAGSRGVSLCQQAKDIAALYRNAQKNSSSSQVIIEEFIEGEQISTETIIAAKQCYHPGFATRTYSDTRHFYPYIMENGGWQPSPIEADKKEAIYTLLEQIVGALQIENGVLKGDIVYSTKYQQAMVIEVASRLSGGDFSASLVPLAHGINYVKTAIQIALSCPIDSAALKATKNSVVANRYLFLPQGELTEINVPDAIKQLPQLKKLEFNYQINDVIPKIENHGQRVGVFIIEGDDYQEVQAIIDMVYDALTFVVNGRLTNAHPKHYIHK